MIQDMPLLCFVVIVWHETELCLLIQGRSCSTQCLRRMSQTKSFGSVTDGTSLRTLHTPLLVWDSPVDVDETADHGEEPILWVACSCRSREIEVKMLASNIAFSCFDTRLLA